MNTFLEIDFECEQTIQNQCILELDGLSQPNSSTLPKSRSDSTTEAAHFFLVFFSSKPRLGSENAGTLTNGCIFSPVQEMKFVCRYAQTSGFVAVRSQESPYPVVLVTSPSPQEMNGFSCVYSLTRSSFRWSLILRFVSLLVGGLQLAFTVCIAARSLLRARLPLLQLQLSSVR